MSGHTIPMSQETFERLTKQLKNLKKIDRPAIIAEIAAARAQGDLNENAEYGAAKERQAQIESSISIIEDKLARAQIIKIDVASSSHIVFGATVEAEDTNSGKTLTYTLVGPDGINLMENKISSKSPIGKGLLGKKVGDIVEISTPKGKLVLKVLKFY